MAWPPTLLHFLKETSHNPGRLPIEVRLPPLLDALGPLPFPVIKVTGTNGKGSVCAMLAAALQADGHKVGCFTSPHLFHVGERISINGGQCSTDEMEQLAQQWQQRLAGLEEAHFPSFFEILLLMALSHFIEQNVSIVILEAGIGGRHCATRWVPEVVAALTTVGLDHGDRLGHTLSEVTAHKSDICKQGGVLVAGPNLPPEAMATLQERTLEKEVRLEVASPALDWLAANQGWSSLVTFAGDLTVHLPLIGAHQRENLATVHKLLEELQKQGLVASTECLKGVAQTQWLGRVHKPLPKQRLILDVAHNPQGLQALARSLDELGIPLEARVLVYGVAAEKDLTACCGVLPQLAKRVWLIDGFYRATGVGQVAAQLGEKVEICGHFTGIKQALALAVENAEALPCWVIITGSLFLVGETYELLAR